jgi:hypothetical protein
MIFVDFPRLQKGFSKNAFEEREQQVTKKVKKNQEMKRSTGEKIATKRNESRNKRLTK